MQIKDELGEYKGYEIVPENNKITVVYDGTSKVLTINSDEGISNNYEINLKFNPAMYSYTFTYQLENFNGTYGAETTVQAMAPLGANIPTQELIDSIQSTNIGYRIAFTKPSVCTSSVVATCSAKFARTYTLIHFDNNEGIGGPVGFYAK